MAVAKVDINRREAYASGQAFGESGAYERIDGTLDFAVDPANEANLRPPPRAIAGLWWTW